MAGGTNTSNREGVEGEEISRVKDVAEIYGDRKGIGDMAPVIEVSSENNEKNVTNITIGIDESEEIINEGSIEANASSEIINIYTEFLDKFSEIKKINSTSETFQEDIERSNEIIENDLKVKPCPVDVELKPLVEIKSEIIDKCAEVIDIKLGQERSPEATTQYDIEINSEVVKPPAKVVLEINLSFEASPEIISTSPNLYETSPERIDTSNKDIEIDQTVKKSSESMDTSPDSIDTSPTENVDTSNEDIEVGPIFKINPEFNDTCPEDNGINPGNQTSTKSIDMSLKVTEINPVVETSPEVFKTCEEVPKVSPRVELPLEIHDESTKIIEICSTSETYAELLETSPTITESSSTVQEPSHINTYQEVIENSPVTEKCLENSNTPIGFIEIENTKVETSPENIELNPTNEIGPRLIDLSTETIELNPTNDVFLEVIESSPDFININPTENIDLEVNDTFQEAIPTPSEVVQTSKEDIETPPNGKNISLDDKEDICTYIVNTLETIPKVAELKSTNCISSEEIYASEDIASTSPSLDKVTAKKNEAKSQTTVTESPLKDKPSSETVTDIHSPVVNPSRTNTDLNTPTVNSSNTVTNPATEVEDSPLNLEKSPPNPAKDIKATSPLPSIEDIINPLPAAFLTGPTLGSITRSNPLWNSFLDTDCTSATDFFSLPISSKTEVRAPKPWVSNKGSTFRKVAFTITKKPSPPPKIELPKNDVAFPFAQDAYPFAGDDLSEKNLDEKIKKNIKVWRESQPEWDEIKAFDLHLDDHREDDTDNHHATAEHDKVTKL